MIKNVEVTLKSHVHRKLCVKNDKNSHPTSYVFSKYCTGLFAQKAVKEKELDAIDATKISPLKMTVAMMTTLLAHDPGAIWIKFLVQPEETAEEEEWFFGIRRQLRQNNLALQR